MLPSPSSFTFDPKQDCLRSIGVSARFVLQPYIYEFSSGVVRSTGSTILYLKFASGRLSLNVEPGNVGAALLIVIALLVLSKSKYFLP